MFHTATEEREKMTEKQKRQWIEETTTTVHQCIHDHKKNDHGTKGYTKLFWQTRKIAMKQSGSFIH